MKYTMEMESGEFSALIKMVEKIIDAAHCTEVLRMEQEHEKAMSRLKREAGQRKHTFIVDDVDEDSDEDSDMLSIDDYSEEEVETPPIHFTVHSNEEKTEGEESKPSAEDEHILKYSKGEETFAHLLKVWLIDFCYPPDENAPTSTLRADELKRLSLNKDGRRMLYYLEHMGGLTVATHNTWPEAHDADKIRYVAENIAQVSSILFSEISDLLEYPNPLEE
jgi:hypothetical protein